MKEFLFDTELFGVLVPIRLDEGGASGVDIYVGDPGGVGRGQGSLERGQGGRVADVDEVGVLGLQHLHLHTLALALLGSVARVGVIRENVETHLLEDLVLLDVLRLLIFLVPGILGHFLPASCSPQLPSLCGSVLQA